MLPRSLTVAGLLALWFSAAASAQSVKLPNWNSAGPEPCPASFFFQPLDELKMFDGDGALFICLEMPRGETKTQNGKYGFVTYLMGTH